MHCHYFCFLHNAYSLHRTAKRTVKKQKSNTVAVNSPATCTALVDTLHVSPVNVFSNQGYLIDGMGTTWEASGKYLKQKQGWCSPGAQYVLSMCETLHLSTNTKANKQEQRNWDWREGPPPKSGDLRSGPSSHVGRFTTTSSPAPGDLTFSFGLCGHLHTLNIHSHTCLDLINLYKIT